MGVDFRSLINIVSSPEAQTASYLREYLEYQVYEVLLEDQRLDYLYKTYGEKQIPAAWERAKGNAPPEVLQHIETQQGENDSQKVINYIASFDPSPNHQYAQWLVIRWLKNGFLLEDLPRAREDIELFQQVKQRLAQKDINQYKTLADLHDAIAPLIQQDGQPQEQLPVSKRDEKRELHDRMSVPPQANIIYNDADIKIIHPLTKEASCYWGVNTRWCTAATGYSNAFDSYNDRSPLYIILIKSLNKRYQFHFDNRERGYSYSQFMDEQDRSIDLGEFLQKYPIVFKILGEKNFAGEIDKIGLHWFSQEATKSMSLSQLEKAIHNIDDLKMVDPIVVPRIGLVKLGTIVRRKSDLKYIPVDIQKTLDFQQGLIQSNSVREHRTRFIKFLPEDYYKHHLSDLLHYISDFIFNIPTELVTSELLKEQVKRFPQSFKDFSDEWRTTELAHLVADKLIYGSILDIIPKQWQDEYVINQYWKKRVQTDTNLHLKDVPEKYWTEETISKCLRNYTSDIEKYKNLLTDRIVKNIIYGRQYDQNVIEKIPKQFLTKEIFDNTKKFYSNRDKYYRSNILKLFPSVIWDEETTLSGIHQIKHFNEIAEDLQNNGEIVADFIQAHLDAVDEVPDKHIHPYVIEQLLTSYSTDKAREGLTNLVKRGLVPQQTILDTINDSKNQYRTSAIYEKLPDECKTSTVISLFANKGDVPIKDLPQSLQTPKILLRRLKRHPDEFENVPTQFQNSKFGLVASKLNDHVIAHIPDSMLTEPILYQLLQHHVTGYYNHNDNLITNNFKRFPKTLWSNRTVAAALDKHKIEPSMKLYDEYPSEEVAVAILKQKPEWYSEFSATVTSDKKAIAKIAERNAAVLLQLDPADITEEMAYAVIDGSGKHWDSKRINDDFYRRSEWSSNEHKVYEHIPRSVWSKRIYMSAIGRLVDLKDVPAKFRDDKMRIKAIQYAPKNVLAIPNAAHWLNTAFKHEAPGEDRGKIDKDWRENMEKVGFIYTRKGGWMDVRKLEKSPLVDGYTVAVTSSTVNRRAYIFSPRGTFLCYLYSEKGEVFFPYKVTDNIIAKLQKPIMKAVEESFSGFDIENLNRLYIYKIGGNIIKKEQLNKHKEGNLTYTSVNHNKEHRYELFYKNKLILSLITDTRSGFGNSGNVWLGVEKIYDYKTILEQGLSLGAFLKNNKKKHINYSLKDLGVMFDRKGTYEGMYTEKKLAEKGNLIVYINGESARLSVFDLEDHDLVATAKIKKDGGIYGITAGSGRQEVGSKYVAMLEKAAEYAKELSTH